MRNITFEPDKIYHIYNRGVERRAIFSSDRDRWRFLQGLYLFNDTRNSSNILFRLERDKKSLNFTVLKQYMELARAERKPLVRIMAYCLKSNHYHFLVQPIKEDGVSRFMHKLGTGYTKYFNTKYNRVGSLFQGTFKAVPVETDAQLQYVLVYINVINPGQEIEAELKERGPQDVERILKFAEGYWSTHQEYLAKRVSVILDKGITGNLFSNPVKYENFARDILLGKKRAGRFEHLFLEK